MRRTEGRDDRRGSGLRLGILGLASLVAGWLALYVASLRALPGEWAPRIWILSLGICLPSAVICGLFAGRMVSGWWYLVSATSLLTAGVMIAALGV